jgi:cohesin loading factor subunit SCC2
MHGKHASILGNRTLASATASYDYQLKVVGESVRGLRGNSPPISLLHHWYSLVRDKRSTRQEFLKHLLRAFDVPADLAVTEGKANFVRYIAEVLSAFDYRTQEEPLSIIRHLTSVLSTTGMQIASYFSEQSTHHDTTLTEAALPPTIPIMHGTCCAVLVIIAMNLKSYLKNLYGLSEERCSAYDAKRSAFRDKATARRTFSAISWHNIVTSKPSALSVDVTLLRKEFLELWNEDGVKAEPEEEMNMDL